MSRWRLGGTLGVGFEGGFGPKGLGNLAQALAWVALFYALAL